MLLAVRPTTAGLGRLLAAAVDAPLTYDGPLAAREAPYVLLDEVTPLGAADAGALADRLLGWELHRAAGMVLATSAPGASPGCTVVNAAAVGPVAVVAPCRVVARVAEPGRVGFAYATLPGHPLVGVEQFTVETDATGQVVLRIRSVSRPVGPARIAPLLARAGQRWVDRRYAAAARRLVG